MTVTRRLLLLELHQYRKIHPVFVLSKIGRPTCNYGARRTLIAARRCYASRTREIRHVRNTVIELPAERDVLAWHVVHRPRRIPGLVWIAGIFCKVRSS